MELIKEKIFTFFEGKRYWYFFPKKIRFLIWNIKFLKLYKTKTGFYYLPFFAFKDRIRDKIINNQITDELVYNKIQEFIKKDSIVLDVGARLSISASLSKFKDMCAFDDNAIEEVLFPVIEQIFTFFCLRFGKRFTNSSVSPE